MNPTRLIPRIITIALLQLLISFNSSYAMPENVSGLIITTASKIDICCATLGSQIDQLTNIVETNFAATFTAIDAICDNAGTYTLLNTAIAQEFTTQSKLDICCSTLNSKVDVLTSIVNTDFAGTFTAIAAIPAANFTGTYTLLNTAIAQEITTQSKIDLCCLTLNSKVDALTSIVNTDFAGTFTAIAAISGGSCDLSGTYTVLNALGLCNAIPLSLTSVGTTIATPGVYCLTKDVALGASNTILIASSGVVLDLNGHTVSGATSATAAITIGINTNPNVNRVIVRNGFLANALGSPASGNAIAKVGSFLQSNIIIENLNIVGFNNVINLTNINDSIIRNVLIARGFTSGITFSGSNNILENCAIEQMNGVAYTVSGQNIKVLRCSSYANGSGFNGNGIDSILFDSCTASVHNAAPFYITLNAGAGLCSLINCIANDNTGAFTIIGGDPTNQASLINCQSLRSGGVSPFNIQVSNCILESCIAQYCIGASGFNLGTTPLSNCVLRNCVSNFNDQNGFDLLNTTSCTLENCTADKNTLSGFSLNNASQCLIRNSVASNNGIDGFDCSAAGECCIIQDSTATNNMSFGFTGTDANVSFYNNIGNCNSTNFDEFSASSAASGMLDSKIDALSVQGVAIQDDLDQCCSTVVSKIDALTNIVNADFAGTFTAISAISGGGESCDLSGTYTVLNALGQCNEIALTIPASGVTISNPGSYCVTNDAVVTGTAISITASNVVLNLNGHTIQASGTGILLSSIQNVIINNGTISGASQGILVNSAIIALHVSDLDIMSCNNGIISPVSITDTSFKRINFYNNAFRPLNLMGIVQGVLVEDCFTNLSNSYLVNPTASTNNNVTFNRCISTNCPINSSFEINGCRAVLDSCEAINTVGTGFSIFENCQAVLRNCTVTGSGAGFDITGSAILENCVADSSGVGFTFSAGCNGVATNCTASNNTGGSGFFVINNNNRILIQDSTAYNNAIGFDLSNALTECSVVNCIAHNNSSNGFLGDPALNSIFYLNSAVNNPVNYADLSALSAPTVLLTSSSRLYGDNLASTLP